jgi:hypothetical protein
LSGRIRATGLSAPRSRIRAGIETENRRHPCGSREPG